MILADIFLHCDARRCPKEFRTSREMGFPAGSVVRREAAKAGWTRVKNPVGRRFDRDYCPDHPDGRENTGEGDDG